MTHGSLFSGIGGFDLAAQWMGWENKFHCEINPFGQKILKHYWPNSESFSDIKKTNFSKYANQISVLSGGFPCQPFSQAGKRKGTNDERHLWPEMLRAISEISPNWIVGENVFGIVSWDGGLVFEQVQIDLESQGYETTAVVIPAAAVNAPHGRDRVWFIARQSKSNGNSKIKQGFGGRDSNSIGICKDDVPYSNICTKESSGSSGSIEKNGSNNNDKSEEWGIASKFNNRSSSISWDTSYSNLSGWREGNQKNEERPSKQFDGNCIQQSNAFDTIGIGRIEERYDNGNFVDRKKQWEFSTTNCIQNRWREFPSQSPICSGNDGISTKLDGITFSKWRNESIKGYGNAVVPQVVYEIFKTIELYEQKFNNK